MTSASEAFLSEVETYLRRTGMAPSTFGSAVLNDPSFVLRLRRGNNPSLATVDRVRAFIRRHNGKARRKVG